MRRLICLKVHEAAKHLGVTPRTLRFYEEKGLISPYKAVENNYRSYSDEDLIRLRWIISLRELGMPLAAIQEALSVLHQPEAFIRKVDGARALLYEQWITATKSLQALDETIMAWQRAGEAILTQAESAAEEMKHNRILRASWSDQWNYDELALSYGCNAPMVSLEGVLSEDQYHQALLKTAEWLDPRGEEVGLELGAGSGNLSVLLASAGARLTVIEQSAEMLAILRKRLTQVDAKQGNLLALPLAAQSYNFIGCSFTMHHLTHSQQLLALEEMDRVLLNGGRIVISGLMSQYNEFQSDSNNEISALPANWTPISAPALAHWLEERGYSTVTNSINPGTCLLYASKP
jgi:putative AdoMet-dependent methyltransferase